MLEFLFSSVGRVSLRQLWLHFMLPMYIGFFLITLIDTSLLDAAAGSIGPLSLTYNTLMLWPLSVIIGKRIHDRGLRAERYVKHARIWFLLLSVTLVAAVMGGGRFFFASFAVVFVYQMAFAFVLLEVLKSFWLRGQDEDNEFGPRPAS